MQKRFVVLLLVIVALLTLSGELTRDRTGDSGLQLERPSFIALASEAQAQEKGVNFLQQEAGISAYVKVGQAIDLAQVRGAFKTVETVSDEYIIGEVALRDLPEEAHPHVYVNKDGWLVAYYSKDEPASKIMQWIGYGGGAITTTTLEDAIRRIWDAFQGPFPFPQTLVIKYYSFESPSANRIMLIAEVIHGDEEDSFYLTLPAGVQPFKASWALYASKSEVVGWTASLKLWIDGNHISTIEKPSLQYGDLTDRLRRNFRHTISIQGFRSPRTAGVAIVLIYQV